MFRVIIDVTFAPGKVDAIADENSDSSTYSDHIPTISGTSNIPLFKPCHYCTSEEKSSIQLLLSPKNTERSTQLIIFPRSVERPTYHFLNHAHYCTSEKKAQFNLYSVLKIRKEALKAYLHNINTVPFSFPWHFERSLSSPCTMCTFPSTLIIVNCSRQCRKLILQLTVCLAKFCKTAVFAANIKYHKNVLDKKSHVANDSILQENTTKLM